MHQRIVYTFFDLFSDFGGICGIIFPVIFLINSTMSYNIIMGRLIGKLFYHKPDSYKCQTDLGFLMAYILSKDQRKNQVNKVQKLKFTVWEQVYDTFLKPICCLFRNQKFLQNVKLY